MKIVSLFRKNLLNVVLLAFFIIRIPAVTIPFIMPGIYSHHLYRLINFLVLGAIVYFRSKYTHIKPDRLVILVSAYFLFQAMSVFGAVNLRMFLISFEKIFTSFLFFLLAYPLFKSNKNIALNRLVKIIIITTALNVFFQLTMIIQPGLFIKIARQFVHPGVIDIVTSNLVRGRIYFEFYDEITIPILFYGYFLLGKNSRLRILSFFLVLAIVFISFFSNIRTRFLVTVFALVSSFIIFREYFSRNAVKIISAAVAIPVIIFLGYKLVVSNVGFSVIDRFLLQDKVEDEDTISFRFGMIEQSIDMGNSHMLTGVGLGNFYEYIPTNLKNKSFQQKASINALLYPHNIFAQAYAETGLPGLITLIALTSYFLVKDRFVFKGNGVLKKAAAVSFWSLFIYALLNPPTPLTFYANFFILRSIIEI